MLIKEAFETGTFNPSIADTLLATIPKVENPKSFKELRPISLCNTLYKLIITKVMELCPKVVCASSGFQTN
uniref:Reverse transcriptase domain-containing protein n=1 Tax=Cajanus cajan TaxID=3821 RepID=A0A151R4C1_CAJCA|nr:hypothetical protein KK1_041497 [Cajanus cajan]